MAFTAAVGCQGLTLKWGTTDIGVTSLKYSGSAAAEIDITGVDGTIITDTENTNRKLIKKTIDYAVIDMGEVSCDFFGPGEFDAKLLGSKRLLKLDGNTSIVFSVQAFLTQISLDIAAGDLVKGSCTFKLSDL